MSRRNSGACIAEAPLGHPLVVHHLVDRAFDSLVMPVLGFVLVPFTTVIYVLVYQPKSGVNGFGWILVGVGLLIDLGAYGGASRGARR